MPTADPPRRPSFWQRARVWFRGCRIAIWLLILTALCALIYLNQVGLPDFIKRPLLAKLQAQGVKLNFTRLRLSWYRGIIAENVRFGGPGDGQRPSVTAKEVRMMLNYHQLVRRRVQVDSLILVGGRLDWPVPDTNGQPRELTVENIQSQLRFLPGEQWALDRFSARFLGGTFQASAVITNATSIREWPLFKPDKPTPEEVQRSRLRLLADTLEKIQFAGSPNLRLDVSGDARDLQTLLIHIYLDAPATDTPWGKIAAARLDGQVYPAASGALSRASLKLEAERAETLWASATNISLSIDLDGIETHTNIAHARIELHALEAHTQWATAADLNLAADLAVAPGEKGTLNGEITLETHAATSRWVTVSNASFFGVWQHSVTNAIPLAGTGVLKADAAQTKWGSAVNSELMLAYRCPLGMNSSSANPAWGLWTNLHPYELGFELSAEALRLSEHEARELQCGGQGVAPKLLVTTLHARLGEGLLDGQTEVDVDTRNAKARIATDWDAHKIASLLPPAARRWLGRFGWEKPPQVQGDLSLTLPSWTNSAPDWKREVQPTLQIQGQFNAPHGGQFRSIPVVSASSHILYSNMVWRLPNLLVMRPEGQLAAVHRADERTRDYYWGVRSTVDPKIVRPLLDPKAQQTLDLLSLTQPPRIKADIWGNFKARSRTGFRAEIALTNFSFRGQTGSVVQAGLDFTNKLLRIVSPRLERGRELVTADELLADFDAEIVTVTNGFSTADPLAVSRAIGEKIGKAIEPYRFERPPTIRVNGVIPMRNEDKADLFFNIDGDVFHWLRFHMSRISGQLHWAGLALLMTDVRADYHGGRLAGNASLSFPPRQGIDFQFNASFTNVLLQAMMADLVTGTNRLEGTLGGVLHVTRGNSTNWPRSDGYGDMTLHDGLIWDIPLFGFISPVLISVIPGLGNSRASEATGSFRLVNGVFQTEDLDIRTTGVRLAYRGTLDVDGQVNAKVEAMLLRDMWFVGPIVRTALIPLTKLFEYKVTGHLLDLKPEPVYLIPKLVFLPLKPLQVLRDLLPKDSKEQPEKRSAGSTAN
jgi:hypothetical protein